MQGKLYDGVGEEAGGREGRRRTLSQMVKTEMRTKRTDDCEVGRIKAVASARQWEGQLFNMTIPQFSPPATALFRLAKLGL